jgi:LysR family transcriptional regulator, cyn operon transcriptional activator
MARDVSFAMWEALPNLSNAFIFYKSMQKLDLSMDLHQLRTFVAIADAGGVTRAASRLNLSQPAATRQIQVLEATLGLTLFVRIGRRVQLTSDGEDLLRRSRRVLAEAEALRERASALRAGDTGIVTVGATPPMIEAVLADFLVGHRNRHPGVEVRIVEDGGTSLVSRLERGDVHLAYIPVGDDRFVGRLLYPVHVVAAVPAESELSENRVLEIGGLAGQQLLALRRGFGSRDWFDAACDAANIRPSVLLESNSHNAILGLAAAGYGIGILPSAIPVPTKGIHVIPLVHRRMSIGKWTLLAWDPRRFVPPYVERFADELAAYAQDHFPGRDVVRAAPAIRRPTLPEV